MSEYQLDKPPTDSISAVKFSFKSSQHLLVSSWDACVRLYDIETRKLEASYEHSHAVLDCCLTDPNHAFSGGLDKTLKTYDFVAQKESMLGIHNEAIRCVHYAPETNLIITGSWDKTVKLWDPRSFKCVGTYEQAGKVYSLDTSGDRLVVATAGRRVCIWDLRSMNGAENRESSLKFETRALRCFPNRQGFVVSSIEGRVAVEYFDLDPEVQRKKYAFKCHRVKEASIENIYPVNAIAFHNGYNTFATGGSDCMVNIWDGFNKKRLCQFHSYPSGIVSLSFDHTGNYLAIGSSYNYEKGQPIENTKDNIYIRRVSETETKPK